MENCLFSCFDNGVHHKQTLNIATSDEGVQPRYV
jgi:hypothetical protein